MQTSWLLGLVGGLTIGAASALLLVTHGRIAGISGIFGSTLQPDIADRAWRIAFVLGLAVAGTTAEIVEHGRECTQQAASGEVAQGWR